MAEKDLDPSPVVGCKIIFCNKNLHSTSLNCVSCLMMGREMDTLPQENQSLESSHNSGGFDCNICLELAQEPVVTLCGHLYCWPCLYTWLHMNNMPKECPVCKAFVNEEKLVPLYGRGKIEEASDPRTKSVMKVPSRPSGQRTQVSSRPTNTHHPPPHQSFNFMPNPAMGSFGNVSFSGFGLFPYLFGFQMNGASAHSPYATSTSGFHHHHDGTHRFFQQVRQEQQQETFLSRLLLFLGCLVVACLLFF